MKIIKIARLVCKKHKIFERDQMFERLRKSLGDKMRRLADRPFLNGLMAACAVVATVDGKVTLAERARLDVIIDSLERLSLYDVHDAVDRFNEYVDVIIEDRERGVALALEAVAVLASDGIDDGDAALVMKVMLALGHVEQELPEEEVKALHMICNSLRLPVDQYLGEYG